MSVTIAHELAALLMEEADLLDRWAQQSITGGWSTHQVDPMRERADELRRKAAPHLWGRR